MQAAKRVLFSWTAFPRLTVPATRDRQAIPVALLLVVPLFAAASSRAQFAGRMNLPERGNRTRVSHNGTHLKGQVHGFSLTIESDVSFPNSD
jgi:hypothetical protein